MSSPEKRAREAKKLQKKREREARRWEKRERGTEEIPVVTAEDVVGNLRSIDDVMKELEGGSSSGESSRGAASIPARLFVGGLSYDTTSESLGRAFEEFGEVADAHVVRNRDTGESRGFGFVTMADRRDAPKAIDGLNDTELDGRTIVVNVATERR